MMRRLRSRILPVALLCATMGGVIGSRNASGDENESLPDPLGLDQVLQLTRARRPEILASRARARAVGERPKIVSALEDPTITASIDHLPFTLDGVNASLLIQQGFPLSRIRGHRQRSAEAAAQGARAETDRVALDVELDAANAFLMLQQKRQTARILAEQRKLADQFVGAALARYSAGTGVQADVLRAEIEVARLDGELRSIAAEINAAEAMLNTSLARRADLPVPDLQSVASVAIPPEAAQVRQAALDRRPELRVGRSEIDRARAEVSVMKSMYAPMAMVGTGPAYTMFDRAGWMFMFGMSVPIWRGKLRAGVAEAQAMVEMAQADLESMKRMVDGNAVASRAEVVAARERFLALRDQVVPRAQQAIEPSIAGYTSGQLPLVSVIDAAEALWAAQSELVMAEATLGMAWARLSRATGNGGGR
jgi:outer membrane protein, heavy metal efflux system